MKRKFLALFLMLFLKSPGVAGGLPASELYKYGMAAYNNKEYGQAIIEFEEALYVDEEHLDSLKQLSRSYCRLGQYSKALTYVQKAQRKFPLDHEIDEIISKIHMKQAIKKENS